MAAKMLLNSVVSAASAASKASTSKSTSSASEQESSASSSSDDVYSLLAQKENDLVLAAELGKALLEKNEELRLQNDEMSEEFADRLEHLEQEKHRLRLQLEVMEEEYEQRVADLKTDLAKLRAQLLEVETAARDSERERSALAAGLSEQNQRLAGELESAAKREAELQSKLAELRSQFDYKRISMRDHVVHLETMRDEINIVNDRKQTLERRIGELLGEREGLSYNLDETSERIIALERQTREQETQLRHYDREVAELRETNESLYDRLESLSRQSSYASTSSSAAAVNSVNHHHMSLLNELEMSSTAAAAGARPHPFRRPCSQIDELDEDTEMDEDDAAAALLDVESADLKEMREELLSAYGQLRTLCDQVRRRRKPQPQEQHAEDGDGRRKRPSKKRRRHSSDSMMTNSSSGASSEEYTSSSSSSEEGGGSGGLVLLKTTNSKLRGLLSGVVLELQGLLNDLLLASSASSAAATNASTSTTLNRKTCTKSQGSGRSSRAESAVVLEPDFEMDETLDVVDDAHQLERLQFHLRQAEGKLRQKDDEIDQLQSRLETIAVQMKGVEEERDNLKADVDESALGRDEIVKKARESRDAAVKRKNAAEVDLAKERLSVMQVNSQLMEAVQQKVALSQQLDDWKMDMEVLLEDQIRQRLVHSEKKAAKAKEDREKSEQQQNTNRFFGLFQRS